ncbi:MAG: hypothetical protein K9L79_01085 [Methylobacter tundripaludum]|nr:hypothetical protein [Methylobacter tundripaludum]
MVNPHLKPHGRALADFGQLNLAEQKLLDACRSGETADISEHRPERPDVLNTVHASFLRFLALGGDEHAPVHENGVSLQGVWVEGELNLVSAILPHSLGLVNCHLSTINLRYSKVHGFVAFQGCYVDSFDGDCMVCGGDVFLNEGFTAASTVRLANAQIRGSLDCSNAVFNDDRSGDDLIGALVCNNAVIGKVFLNTGFSANGTVSLSGAQIGSDLLCSGGRFDGKGEDALLCTGTVIKGFVSLTKGFTSTGMVCLSGAQIGSYLNCSGATFDSTSNTSPGYTNGLALRAETMTVDGILFFSNLKAVKGAISLMSSKVGSLQDDTWSWLKGELMLDGFVYDKLAGSAPTDAKNRLAWLDKQPASHSGLADNGINFRPQPWKQLQRVLYDMGHMKDMRLVAIAFQDRQRDANLIGQSPKRRGKTIAWIYRKISRGLHWLYGVLLSYGYYSPSRLIVEMLIVWLVCGIFYSYAAYNGVFAPSNPLVFQNPEYAACVPASPAAKLEGYKLGCGLPSVQGAGNWYLCKDLREEYSGFSPLAYSLDLILPLVDLQQEHDWAPMIPTPENTSIGELKAHSLKHVTRLVVWFEILFGWMSSLLLVAVVSGLTKRREE